MIVTAKFAAQLTLVLAAGLSLLPTYPAFAGNSLGEAIPVLSKYAAPASDGDDKPRGISGMACLAKRADGGRECLAIIDEETFGEIVELTSAGLRPTGKKLAITKEGEAGEGILGTEQIAGCPDNPNKKKGKFGELDGEGIAVANGYAYVLSSHSCSGKGKYKPSSYLTSRFKLVSSTSFLTGTSTAVERSWRSADMLLASDVAGGYGGAKANGTNIEGVAVVDGVLYAGLRTPLVNNAAILIGAPIDNLFATGKEKLPGNVVKQRSLMLGADTGIRDLAATDAGGLLILAGPTGSQASVEFKLWHLPAPIATSTPIEIAVIKTTVKAKDATEVPKAESVTIVEQTSEKVTVVINYDNVDEGGPARHEISIKP